MELYTQAQLKQLLENGQAAAAVRTGQQEEDLTRRPVVKWFTPFSAATWLISEVDPEDHDIAFGLADLGVGCPELGSIYIPEVMALKGPMGLRVERDLYFQPDRSLVDYASQAQLAGSIAA
ncbi:MAG: DUF2958 domain-containing protein [Octadecabacter sp.]